MRVHQKYGVKVVQHKETRKSPYDVSSAAFCVQNSFFCFYHSCGVYLIKIAIRLLVGKWETNAKQFHLQRNFPLYKSPEKTNFKQTKAASWSVWPRDAPGKLIWCGPAQEEELSLPNAYHTRPQNGRYTVAPKGNRLVLIWCQLLKS